MNHIQRQLLLTQRRMTGALAATERPALRDEPVRRSDVLRRGIARIDSNEGGGAYKVTELWWDPDEEDWTRASGPLGFEEANAIDYMNNASGRVDQIVRFWEHRGLEGELNLFVDVAGAWSGETRTSSFLVHYSGTNTTGIFHTVPACSYAFLEICIDLRLCDGNGTPTSNHPGYRDMCITGYVRHSWENAFATWDGSDGSWWDLYYYGYNVNGTEWHVGTGISFKVQAQVTAGGELQFRIYRTNAAAVSCVIAGAVRITPFAEVPPGTLEIGNCCCHDDPDWDEFEWGLIP